MAKKYWWETNSHNRPKSQIKYHVPDPDQDIIEVKDSNKSIITILRHKDLEQLAEYVPDHIKESNEWGFFGCTLVGRTEAGRYIVIPIAYYSVPMEVGMASIDYNHEDIDKIGKEITQEIIENKHKVKELFQFMKKHCTSVKLAHGNLSMHKHPSPSSFSGSTGDRSKSAKNPGILYRLQKASDLPVIDYVFSINNNNFVISDFEGKIAQELRPHEERFTTGIYELVTSISFVETTLPKSLYLKEIPYEYRYVMFTNNDLIKQISQKTGGLLMTDLTSQLLEEFESVDYDVIINIDPNQYTKKQIYYGGKYVSPYHNDIYGYNDIFLLDDDFEDYGFGIEGSHGNWRDYTEKKYKDGKQK